MAGQSSMGGGSNISGASSVSRRRHNVVCKCGEPAPIVTTWTNENGNFGRRFYGCGLFKVQNVRQCDFFQWYDEMESNPRDKRIIASLVRKVEGMKKKEADLMKYCVLGWVLAALLLVVLLVKCLY